MSDQVPPPPSTTPAPVAPPAAPISPAAPQAVAQGVLPLPDAAVRGVLEHALRAMPQAPAVAPSAPVVEVPRPVAPVVPPAPAVAPQAPAAEQPDRVAPLRAALVRSEVTGLASRAGAIDPDTVLALLREDFDLTDDGRLVTKADPRISPEDHVKRYLAAKPYLLRPLAPAGGSPAAAVVVPPQAPAKPDLTSAAGLTDLARSTAMRMGLRTVKAG